MPVMRHSREEDDSNSDRWMISYADFITLLFAFFVVMYAISSVNNEKYKVLSDTLQKAFRVEVASLDPVQIGEPASEPSPHVVDVPDTRGYADRDPGNTEITDPVVTAESLLGGFARDDGVDIRSDADWLELNLDASVLFRAGEARLSGAAERTLAPISALLRESNYPVTVEGYTDNVPAESSTYPSNWHLSAARASAVAEFFAAAGIERARLAAVGYGENHPRETNATPEGRARNRRVAVVVARRSDFSRNLNASDTATAKVAVRAEIPNTAPDSRRTPAGGLLFSNEPGDANE